MLVFSTFPRFYIWKLAQGGHRFTALILFAELLSSIWIDKPITLAAEHNAKRTWSVHRKRENQTRPDTYNSMRLGTKFPCWYAFSTYVRGEWSRTKARLMGSFSMATFLIKKGSWWVRMTPLILITPRTEVSTSSNPSWYWGWLAVIAAIMAKCPPAESPDSRSSKLNIQWS